MLANFNHLLSEGWEIIRTKQENKMAEEIMETYHSLLCATLDATTDSILIVNLDGKIVSFNQKYAHMWQIPDEVLESRDHNLVLEFVLEQLKDPEWFQEKIRENNWHPNVSSSDVVEFKDGRYFELYSQPQRLRGEIVGTAMSFRDVTERIQAAAELLQTREQVEIKVEERTAELKKANEQLQNEIAERIRVEEELKQRIRLAELNSDIGIALIGGGSLQDILQQCAEALVRHLDAAFARIWTLNQDENVLELQASAGMYTQINGTHSRIPVGKFKIGAIAAARQPHLTNAVIGDPRIHNQEWAAREGIVAFAGYPLIVSEQLVGVIAIFARQPIADFILQAMGTVSHGIALGIQSKEVELALNQAKQKLAKEKELNDLKSRFISMASHDLRTPLTVIFLASDLLKNFGSKLSADKQLHQLNKIQTAVKNMTQLLDDVLFIGKAESGRLEVYPVILDIEAFCREILEEIKMTSVQIHTLVFDCQRRCQSGGCSVFQIDPKLLRQILSNLLSNAVKYSPKGGNVYFNLVCEDEQAIFHIRDEGIGIPASEQSHLFEAFHRATNVGNISGTGLGMTIVKNAVELHGGSISFESEVCVGTTFTVCLPASQPKFEE